MDDLRGIIATAIHLSEISRRVLRWEADTDWAERTLRGARPEAVGEVCRRLSTTYSETSVGFTTHVAHQERTRERAARIIPLAGAEEVLAEQSAEAADYGACLVAVRSRLRRLDSAIGDAIVELRDQSIEERLLRLAPADGSMRTMAEIDAAFTADHHAIADAMGDWRLMHGGGPVITIADSTPRADIAATLARMVKAGTATRLGTGFVGYKWTFPKAEAVRKAA